MTEIYLLRHGEVAGGKKLRGKTDDTLTALGWQQMHQSLAPLKFDHVISSPLLRCAQFATEYAHLQQLPVSFEPKLAEIDFGDWDGILYEELFAQPHSTAECYFANPYERNIPNGEAMTDFATRVEGAINNIAVGYTNQRVLVVTHGGVIRHFLTHLLGFGNQVALPKYLPIDISHGAIIKLICYQNQPDKPQFCWQI